MIGLLRDATWVTRARLVRWGIGIGTLWLVLLAEHVILHLGPGGNSAEGGLLGGDFVNFWGGARLAVTGQPWQAYDTDWFLAFEAAAVGPPGLRWYSYPPVTMMLCIPFSLLPFAPAFGVWVVAGAGSCFLLLRRLIGSLPAAIAVIAAPAAYLNTLGGQNGYFTAALLGGGLMVLDRRPLIAGICFGSLVYKPHFGLLIPIALAAGGYWRAFAAAAAMALLLTLASVGVLGTATWIGFFHQIRVEREVLETEGGVWPFMVTIFTAARLAGASLSLAGVVQTVSGIAAAAGILSIWRSAVSTEIKAAGLVIGTFVATPHAWGYDEIVLLFAACWLGREGLRSGFLTWERLAVLGLVMLPLWSGLQNVLFSPGIRLAGDAAWVHIASIPPEPVALWIILVLLVRRLWFLPDSRYPGEPVRR